MESSSCKQRRQGLDLEVTARSNTLEEKYWGGGGGDDQYIPGTAIPNLRSIEGGRSIEKCTWWVQVRDRIKSGIIDFILKHSAITT